MTLPTVAQLVALALGPTAVVGALVLSPRLVRALVRLRARGRPEPCQPAGPPIERTAADLRRLLAQHDAIAQAPGMAGASRLLALRLAITRCALDAARALEVPAAPPSGEHVPLPPSELARLLDALTDAGLALPRRGSWGRQVL